MSCYQKGKTVWILLKRETMGGGGISWMLFLPPIQQCQSTEGTLTTEYIVSKLALS